MYISSYQDQLATSPYEPSSWLAVDHAQYFNKLLKFIDTQKFSKTVRNHFVDGYLFKVDNFFSNQLLYLVILDRNMLGLVMILWIISKFNYFLIVSKNGCGRGGYFQVAFFDYCLKNLKFSQEASRLNSFTCNFGLCNILCFAC